MTPSAAHTRIAAPAADSASGTPGTPVLTEYVPGPDTLRTETASGESGSALFPFAATGAAPSEWRDTTSAAIFGAQSTLAEPARIPLAPPPSLTENAVFQSFVLLLAATYAMLLYRNLGDVRTLLGRISRDTATGERLSEDPGGSGYSRFLNIATAIGLLFSGRRGGQIRRHADARPAGRGHSAGRSPDFEPPGLARCAGRSRLSGNRRAAGRDLDPSQPFIAQLMLLKRTYFALGVVLISPPLLLFALCPQGTGGVWFCIVAIELTAAAVLYLKETLNLFLSKKSFDFALVFVPLHRGSLPNQPIMAACGKMKRQRQT